MHGPRARRRGGLCAPNTMRAAVFLAAATFLGSAGPVAPALAQDADDETAAPSIYRWIDENGIAHYTTELDRIPSALRGRAASLGSRRGDSPAPAPSRSEDLWVSRDRSPGASGTSDGFGDFGDDGFDQGDGGFDDRPAEPRQPLDPEAAAAAEEERAVAQFDLDLRIAELEQVIQADEESLKVLISDPASGGPLASAENEEFRTIAVRLPNRLKELQTLRDQRAAMADDADDAE